MSSDDIARMAADLKALEGPNGEPDSMPIELLSCRRMALVLDNPDPIHYDESKKHTHTLGYERPTNNAGGLEAGMTNGQPLVVRAAKKPISTLRKPLASINLATKEPEGAEYERSDVCAVPAAGVILENVVAFEVAAALIEKFGGDSLVEMKARYELFLKMARER